MIPSSDRRFISSRIILGDDRSLHDLDGVVDRVLCCLFDNGESFPLTSSIRFDSYVLFAPSLPSPPPEAEIQFLASFLAEFNS